KAGSGTLVLGSANTFTGAGNATTGQIHCPGNGACGNPANVVTFGGATSGGMNLTGSFTSSRTFNFNNGDCNQNAGVNATFTGSLGGTGTFGKAGPGNLTLTAPSARTGNNFLEGGVLRLE